VRLSGDVPAEVFLRELEEVREKGKDKPQTTARARFLQLFQQMADYGRVSPKRFSVEMQGLYAFKHEVRKVQIRFPCFPDGPDWILTHGFFKPGAKKGRGQWPENEVNRALEIRAEYFQKKQSATGQRNGKDSR
jgi:hypothetical protein